MSWSLNPALTRFRAAVNARYGARRDMESDGTIGDRAHQNTTSDHNPDPDGSVDAWDMDVDVNGRGQPYADDIEMLKLVFQRHPSARYWIHDGQIAHRNDGWRRRPYTGGNPHDKHVHWNTDQRYENSTAPWELEDDMLKDDERQWLRDVHFVLTAGIPSPDGSGGRVPHHVAMAALDASLDALATKPGISAADLAAVKTTAAEGARAGASSALTPQALADAIPDELAQQVADLLSARLAA